MDVLFHLLFMGRNYFVPLHCGKKQHQTTSELINVLHFLCYILIMNPFLTGHRALEKKQITQGNNRKVQNPGESLEEGTFSSPFLFFCTPEMPTDAEARAEISLLNLCRMTRKKISPNKFGFSFGLASLSSFSLAERVHASMTIARSGVSCTNFNLLRSLKLGGASENCK